MNEVIVRTPHMIATEIYSIKSQAQNVILLSSVEIGKRLIEAKGMLSHGEWGDWLKNSVNYSQRTATNLMGIYKEYGESGKLASALANLNYTQAVALLGVPADDREAFIEENDVEGMSTRELQAAIKELNALKKQQETSADMINTLAAERNKLIEERSQLEQNVSTGTRVIKEHQKTIKQLQNDLESTRKRSAEEVDRLSKSLQDARQSDESIERIEQLEIELIQAKNQLREATERANAPVTLEPVVVEKVPEEIERELRELREKVQQAAAPAGGGSEALVKYKLHFDSVVSGFNSLIGTLEEFEDPESRQKYKTAAAKLLGKMQEQLGVG